MTEPLTAEFMGNPSVARPPKAAGTQAAYAPHLYDIVVDTDDESGFSPDRLALIARTHAADAARWGVPLILGEWGAFVERYGNDPMSLAHADLFERMHAKEAYWDYRGPESVGRNRRYARGLHRAVAVEVPGRIERITSSPDERRLVVEWNPNGGAETGRGRPNGKRGAGTSAAGRLATKAALFYVPGSPVGEAATRIEVVERTAAGCYLLAWPAASGGYARATVCYEG